MAKLKTWAEWEKAGLSEAERKLAECCKAGKLCRLGDGTRPDEPSLERTIRADFLRYLILGGCDACPVAERGVNLIGAYVTERLNLDFCTAHGKTRLGSCCFERRISVVQAKFDRLSLSGSAFPGLNAQRIEVMGNVYLRRAEVEGVVSLSGARIGGQLTFVKTTLCRADGHALNAQQMRVEGGFFWREVTVKEGTIHLAAAHVSGLADDLNSWPEGERVFLNGFTYDRIAGSFTDAKTRLYWLSRGTVREGDFFPQPYTHLANVLRGMGHDREARTVLITRERLKRRYIRKRAQTDRLQIKIRRKRPRIEPDGTWGVGFRSYGVDLWNVGVDLWAIWTSQATIWRYGWSHTLCVLAGYGYAPWRSLRALIVFWLVAAFIAAFAWNEGSFAPNDGPVLVSADWQKYATGDYPNPAAAWSAKGAPGQDWDSFNRYGYAADLVVPILDLGQTAAWAPSKDRGTWGYRLWWGRWVLASLGWVVTALGAAALAGVGRRD